MVSYADLFGGQEYTLTPTGTSRNSLLLGVLGIVLTSYLVIIGHL